MSKLLRILKIGIAFILFVILVFIISIFIFSVLEKYNLLNNKIIKFIINLISVIIGAWFIQFLIKKIK